MILVLQFFLLFANANCHTPAAVLGVPGAFPIERFYPGPYVKFGRNGVNFSRSSKAFIAWRANTPYHIPDEAFVFHYIETGREKEWIIAATRHPERPDKEPFRLHTTSQTLEPELHRRDSRYRDPTKLRLRTDYQYLLIRRQGTPGLIVYEENQGIHQQIAEAVRAADPDIEVLLGGRIDFKVLVDENNVVSYQPTTVSDSGTLLGIKDPGEAEQNALVQALQTYFNLRDSDVIRFYGLGFHDTVGKTIGELRQR